MTPLCVLFPYLSMRTDRQRAAVPQITNYHPQGHTVRLTQINNTSFFYSKCSAASVVDNFMFRFPLRKKKKLISLYTFRKETEQSFSPWPQTEENGSKNCVNGSLNPFLGSREGKYQSRLFRLDCARLESSHLHGVMSYSKSLFDVRGR